MRNETPHLAQGLYFLIQQGEKIYNDTMLHLHIHTTDGGTNMDWNLGYGTADCGESVYAL